MRTKRTVIVVDNTPLARQIGARLRLARQRAGLTQAQLAEGRYTPAYISALERGLAKPSMAALTFIAERLGAKAHDFLREPDDLGPRQIEADIALAAGEFERAIDLYTGLLDRPLDQRARAHVQTGLAEALCRVERGPEAVPHAAAAREGFASAGRDPEALYAAYWLAYGHYQADNLEEARALLGDMLQRVRAGVSVAPDFRFRVLTAMANVESREGEDERAIAYLHEAQAVTADLELRKRAAFLSGLAISYREAGDYEASISSGAQSLALHRAAQAPADQATLSNNLAITYLRLGNTERASELVQTADELAAAAGDERLLAHVRETQSQIALARDDLTRARLLATEAHELASRTNNRVAAASALQTLGAIALREGDSAGGVRALEQAVELLRETKMRARLQDALALLAKTVAAGGDHERANRLYAEALDARRR